MKFIDINREGSPPRMRGKDHGLQHIAPDAGITPACAGKSCPPQAPTFTRQDHPRLCGEKSGHNGLQLGILGITPAYAGKSMRRCNCTHPAGDHPRVCGEKTLCSAVSILK